MTLPAPHQRERTRIVFVGSTRDELLTVDVEEDLGWISRRRADAEYRRFVGIAWAG